MVPDNQVGLATGWCLDRNLPFENACCDTISQSEPLNEGERQYYEQSYKLLLKIRSVSIWGFKPAGIGIPWIGYLISPQRIRTAEEPFGVAYTGYGCVMVRKEVNDKISHLVLHDGYMYSEGWTVCIGARKAGFKVMVDPTCYCEHLD